MPSLREQFGPIDIYLFDQLLRGRITPGMRIFDAGCGAGRNLTYFFRENYDIHGVDADPRAIASLPPGRFRAEPLESHSFPDHFADVVLSSAVLHFARDDAHFHAMLQGSWRVLKPGGLFFCRLASNIGMESRMVPIAGRSHLLPDGSERFLVDEPYLLALTAQLNATLLDPLKTTIVQDQRCMTTWIMRK